jgi:hypothetical protein
MKSGSPLVCFHPEKQSLTLDPIVYLIIFL